MNEREQYVAALIFGQPDKVPLSPGSPRESTLRAWREQGLPDAVDWHAHLLDLLGIDERPQPRDGFSLDGAFKMIPTFEEKVLEHHDGHYVVQDWMGAITEISDEYDVTYIRSARDFVTRKWHRFPVENRRDWEEKIKWRYDVEQAGRFPENFDAMCDALNRRTYPFQVTFPGPFWQLREWCGFEKLCLLMADDPGFVMDMVETWQVFATRVLERILSRVTPDQVMVNEDMAYKLHSMISPRMIRRFVMPSWTAWIDLQRRSGVPVIAVDSDGYIDELMPLWVEAGFNCNFPVEVAAGNDLPALRRQYGRKMAYLGGIDKRCIAAGGEAMREEVLRVVPPLLAEGGYIPGCDHGVPPDIAWPDFVEYARLLGQLTGWI